MFRSFQIIIREFRRSLLKLLHIHDLVRFLLARCCGSISCCVGICCRECSWLGVRRTVLSVLKCLKWKLYRWVCWLIVETIWYWNYASFLSPKIVFTWLFLTTCKPKSGWFAYISFCLSDGINLWGRLLLMFPIMPWLIILEICKVHSISPFLVGVILSSTHLRQCFHQCTYLLLHRLFPPGADWVLRFKRYVHMYICTSGCDSEFVQSDDTCGGRAPVDVNTNGRGLDYY